jgi:hypothetical protein
LSALFLFLVPRQQIIKLGDREIQHVRLGPPPELRRDINAV